MLWNFYRAADALYPNSVARYREVFVHEYRIIYRIDGNKVQILAVIHGRRLRGNTRLGG